MWMIKKVLRAKDFKKGILLKSAKNDIGIFHSYLFFWVGGGDEEAKYFGNFLLLLLTY